MTTDNKDAGVRVKAVKCPCGDPVCNMYGLSDGNFYQGCGWPKERAQEYANAISSLPALLRSLAEIAELDGDAENQQFKLTRFQAAQVARAALSAVEVGTETATPNVANSILTDR